MQVGNVSQPVFAPERNKQQVTSVDEQIRKLEQRKEKLEEDLHKSSGNPDARAAQGENAANRNFNSAEIQKLEAQLANLRSRQEREIETSEEREEETLPSQGTRDANGTLGVYVDEFV